MCKYTFVVYGRDENEQKGFSPLFDRLTLKQLLYLKVGHWEDNTQVASTNDHLHIRKECYKLLYYLPLTYIKGGDQFQSGMEAHTKQQRTQRDLSFSFISKFMGSQDDNLSHVRILFP